VFGLSPKLPVTDEQRMWVDDGFKRLERSLGRSRMLEAKVVEPTAEDFPDPYDKSPQAVEKLFARVCAYMRVDRNTIELEIFQDETEELREILPSWRDGGGKRAAGLYVHAHEQDRSAEGAGRLMVVALRSTLLQDPTSLVATAAHELGHVILLGGKLLRHDTADHEPLTDLLTVYLGLGVFTANSAAQFKQFQQDRRIGWSTQRLGYLPQAVFGYALARFATERGDHETIWARHLSANVRSDFKNSKRWLAKNQQYVALAKPIG
jgi:hypothetical protein